MTKYNDYWNDIIVCNMLEVLWELPQYGSERKYTAKKIMQFCTDGKLLEIGSGVGTLYQFMKKLDDNNSLSNRYQAIDLSTTLINKFKNNFPEVNVELGNAENLTFDSDFFDGVIIYDILRHQPDYTLILSEALRVSKKYLFVSENFLTRLGEDKTNGKDVVFNYSWNNFDIYDNWLLRSKFKNFVLSLFENATFDESNSRLIIINKYGE